MSDEFAEMLQEAAEEMKKYETCMALRVSEDGGAVEIWLDTGCNSYSEHIPGEGADICLYRDMETHKVVGCRLPLMNRKLAISHDGPLAINEGFLKEEYQPASWSTPMDPEIQAKVMEILKRRGFYKPED